MNILEIQIDKENPAPQHKQLAVAIKKLIKQKNLKEKEYLPGERTLAKEISVTRDVVHRAYILLYDEGLIEFRNHIGHRLAENCYERSKVLLKNVKKRK